MNLRLRKRLGFQRNILCALPFLAATVLLTGVLACARAPELPPLEPVPHPDLSAAEVVVRDQVAAARDAVETAEGSADGLVQVADAYGSLAETYHAYELWSAAAVAYDNAMVLDTTSPVWPYERGVVAQEQGDFGTARALFAAALERQAGMAPARVRLAESLLALGDHEGARIEAARLVGDDGAAAARGDGLAAVAHWIRGRAAASRGDHDVAVEHFRAVLAVVPGADVVHHPLGQSLMRLGKKHEALPHLEHEGTAGVPFPDPLIERIRNLARSAGALLRRGNQAMVRGRLDQAAALFREGLGVVDESSDQALELRLNLALVLARDGELAEAEEVLRNAVTAHPGSARAHHDLANALRARDAAAEAVEHLRRAVDLEPDYASAWFNLGNALAELQSWEEAGDALDRHLALEPEDRRSRYLRAMAHHGAGNAAAAERQLRGLLREDPTDMVAREGLAKVFTDQGRDADALGLWRSAAELDLPPAERGKILDRAAHLAWRQGRREPAIAAWKRWTEIEPSSSAAFTAYANALQLAGRRQRAEDAFARAAELDPQNAAAWLSEASLRILRGDYAGAAERLERAVALHPEDPGLLSTYARLLATAPDAALRDGARALAMARLAYGIEGRLDYAETVGMALAEANRFEEAVRWQTQLAQQAQARGDRASLGRIVRHLKLYQEQRPVRVE